MQDTELNDTYEKLLRTERDLAKERGDFFSRYFGLPVSLFLSRQFLRLDLSENTASLCMLGSGLLGAAGLAAGGSWVFLGACLLVVHHLFDYVDGQLARVHGTASVSGAVLDRWNHFIVETLTYPALGVGLYGLSGDVSDLLVCWALYGWNRFRVLASGLGQAILHAELERYPRLERMMMTRNLGRSSEVADASPPAAPQEARVEGHGGARPRSALRRFVSEARTASTSYNAFTFVIVVASALTLLPQVDATFLRWVVHALAFYYLLNFLDYSITFLRTDRIERELRSALSERAGNDAPASGDSGVDEAPRD